MLAEFSIYVEYTQILVYISSHQRPGLIWTDEHTAQGFAWSEGIVSFGVPDHDGECLLRVDAGERPRTTDVLWSVQVPFVVSEPLRIGTVFDVRNVDVPRGTYNLVFQALAGNDDYTYIIDLIFAPSDNPSFLIIEKGGGIESDVVLKENAELAG